MTTMADDARVVTGGVDTHKDTHVAVVLDDVGRILDTRMVPATISGYRQLLCWLRSFGALARVGVEGTGSWGAGLGRFLEAEGVEVLEVNRPNRQRRRLRGKSDPADAEAAARAVLAGEATAIPKSGTGPVESIRLLRIARRTAMKARTQAANQIHSVVDTSPEQLRVELLGLSENMRIAKTARLRPGDVATPLGAAKKTLMILARRFLALSEEIAELDRDLKTLVVSTAPALMAVKGVGVDVAGALLVAAGDNPERLRTEASFAALCGSSPIDASSGRQRRHRLNQGGNRIANSALYRVVLCRLAHDDQTKAYMTRRLAEGKTKREVIRCLKRYVARELYKLLTKSIPAELDTEAIELHAAA
jgi:transposase